MPGIPSKDASFVWGTPRNYALTKVQVRSGALKTESSCHSEDTFDFDKGLELATKRLIVKYLDNQVKSIAKGM